MWVEEIPWRRLIGYEFEEHYPFKVEELGLSYLDVRNLLVILRKIIIEMNTNYSLNLDDTTEELIKNRLKILKHGGSGITLENLLRKLSKIKYKKMGRSHNMFTFHEPKPFHKLCGNPLPPVIKRACFNCHKVIIPQPIWSKEVSKLIPILKQELTCPECKKKFSNKTLNCPYCNPEDLSMEIYKNRFPNENPEKAYIFHDDKDSLDWTSPKIEFNRDFFITILKGIEFEQEIYYELKKNILDNQIKLSTMIKTNPNDDWGVEIDILFLDKMKGKIRKSLWVLCAIEVKNWVIKVDSSLIEEFYAKVSPITNNLTFINKGGYSPDAYSRASELNVILDTPWLNRTMEK